MSDLNGFLTRGESEDAPEDKLPPDSVPEERAEPAKEPEKPEPEEKPEADKPEGEDEPEAGGNLGKALAAERAQRRDWKERAARAEAEREMLMRQVEELKRAPVPQQAAPQQPQEQRIPDPVHDPEGFVRYQEEQQRFALVNERLNLSEFYARERHGSEKVDAAVREFQEAAKANPQLLQILHSQPAPYEWLVKQAEVVRAHREIGADPAGYRSRLEAEIRARVLEEMQQQQPAGPGLPRTAPSLASARSAAPRAMPAEAAGDVPLGDILRRR